MTDAKPSSNFQAYDAFGKKGDLKSSLIFLMTNLTLNARNNGKAISNFSELPALLGWGSQIEAFDSIVSVMLIDDSDYKLKRKKLIRQIQSEFFLHRSEAMGRWKIKTLYTKWFRLLCHKLQHFEVYPELTEEDYDSEA